MPRYIAALAMLAGIAIYAVAGVWMFVAMIMYIGLTPAVMLEIFLPVGVLVGAFSCIMLGWWYVPVALLGTVVLQFVAACIVSDEE
jgi:hypothetical protein